MSEIEQFGPSALESILPLLLMEVRIERALRHVLCGDVFAIPDDVLRNLLAREELTADKAVQEAHKWELPPK